MSAGVRSFALASMAFALSACVASHTLVGPVRAPIPADQVTLYLEPPAFKYQEIAELDASSKHSFSFTAVSKTDVVFGRLKAEAARLGANGVVLQGVTDGPVSSLGSGVGTTIVGAHDTLNVGLFGSVASGAKFGHAIAIYSDSP